MTFAKVVFPMPPIPHRRRPQGLPAALLSMLSSLACACFLRAGNASIAGKLGGLESGCMRRSSSVPAVAAIIVQVCVAFSRAFSSMPAWICALKNLHQHKMVFSNEDCPSVTLCMNSTALPAGISAAPGATYDTDRDMHSSFLSVQLAARKVAEFGMVNTVFASPYALDHGVFGSTGPR